MSTPASMNGDEHARLHPELAHEVRSRGFDPASLFVAMARVSAPDPSLQAYIVEVGSSFFVRYVWEPVTPVGTWSDFVLVGDRFEPKSGLALFAQLLLNGAIDLRDEEAVMHALETSSAGSPVRTRKEAEALANGEGADRRLFELWEPPSIEGRALRFCYDDGQRTFGALTVDVETGAVVVEKRCRAPIHWLEGRGYFDGDRQVIAASSFGERNAHEQRHVAARAWRAAALAEHASIASFARASIELLAVGAPLALVRRMHEAALDEIEHTRLSLAIARELDGLDLQVGALEALPPRAASRERVARDTLMEAAIPELVAAEQAREAARRCRVPSIRDALLAIAEDEARHAQLAWDVIAWCAVEVELPPVPPFASLGRASALEALGVLEEASKRAVAHDVVARCVARPQMRS